MVRDVHADLMTLLRNRLEAFQVPNEVIRQIRDECIEILTPKPTKKNGAAVMTPEASMAGDKIRNGELDNKSPTARPKVV